jgi:hypothetical protein
LPVLFLVVRVVLSWGMAFIAIVLHVHLEEPVNIGKVLEMIIVHDVAEIRAGDYHAFRTVPANKVELELIALKEIVQNLDAKVGKRIVSLWQEFEQVSVVMKLHCLPLILCVCTRRSLKHTGGISPRSPNHGMTSVGTKKRRLK